MTVRSVEPKLGKISFNATDNLNGFGITGILSSDKPVRL